MPQNIFFLRTRNLLVSQKTTQKHIFSTLHHLSTIIFATATVLAFVLLRNSRFNFHCYTQREATPTQKSARKCAVTSRNLMRERLQSAFTLANQLRWIAQLLVYGVLSANRIFCFVFATDVIVSCSDSREWVSCVADIDMLKLLFTLSPPLSHVPYCAPIPTFLVFLFCVPSLFFS